MHNLTFFVHDLPRLFSILGCVYCIVICSICKLDVFNKENKVIYKDIEYTGSHVELCGIPDKSIWKTLSVSFIFTLCFLRFSMIVWMRKSYCIDW